MAKAPKKKKTASTKKHTEGPKKQMDVNEITSFLEEPVTAYLSKYTQTKPREYNYMEFKKLAEKSPFTIKEWAIFLHLSERTLQRYAKDNSVFDPIYSDRIRQLQKVITRGTEVFGDEDRFNNWLRSNPYILEGRLSLQSLTNTEGIHLVLTQLGRIEHGLFS